jgi:hypothetical protein
MLGMYFQQSKRSYKIDNTPCQFWDESSSDHAVPIAAVYGVR